MSCYKKLIILFLFALLFFTNPNSSYAKLIEFEKCYLADNVLTEDGKGVVDIDKVKWNEDFYNIYNTMLAAEYDPKNYDKIIKIKNRPDLKLIERHSVRYYGAFLNKKLLKDYYDEFKELEKQGFKKIKLYDKDIISISTQTGTVTQFKIRTDAFVGALDDEGAYYDALQKRYQGQNFKPTKRHIYEKTITNKYKITEYAGGLLKATQSDDYGGGFKAKTTLIFNLNNSTYINDYQSTGMADTKTFICKSLSAIGKKNDYTQYWWALILIAAVIFFIYTQSGRELKIRK